MGDSWRSAIGNGDTHAFTELVLAAAPSREAAVNLIRNSAELLSSEPAIPAEGAALDAPLARVTNGDGSGSSAPPLHTVESVQMLQPRGRFDLEFRGAGLTLTGKAGTLTVEWSNMRHCIRFPRPAGYSWGKNLNPDDPAGSDLLALPLCAPLTLRKSKVDVVIIQPDPKVQHGSVSIETGGALHQICGSQGTVIGDLIGLLSSAPQRRPDRNLFVSCDGKSFVNCYHGVDQGSLYPLKQGILFLKPGLFLPRDSIAEVVCGRGGSATTRYVDLVVTMEPDDDEGAGIIHEFSNIERGELARLQEYVQNALIAPRQRAVQRAAAAAMTATAGGLGDAPGAMPASAGAAAAGMTTLRSASESEPGNTSAIRARAEGEAVITPAAGQATGIAIMKSGHTSRSSDWGSDSDAESDEDFAPSASEDGDSSSSSGYADDDGGEGGDYDYGQEKDSDGDEKDKRNDDEEGDGEDQSGATSDDEQWPPGKRKRGADDKGEQSEVGGNHEEENVLSRVTGASGADGAAVVGSGAEDTDSDENSRPTRPRSR